MVGSVSLTVCPAIQNVARSPPVPAHSPRTSFSPPKSGYNKRLRKLADTMTWLTAAPGAQTSIATDDVWVVDSTPVECARSRQTVRRSELAGWAEYSYRASHSRFFWGRRLHLVCTLHALPIGWALTGAKADERLVLTDILTTTPALARRDHTRMLMIGDKNYSGTRFETDIAHAGITQRILALTAAIWHNDHLGLNIRRPLTAHDH